MYSLNEVWLQNLRKSTNSDNSWVQEMFMVNKFTYMTLYLHFNVSHTRAYNIFLFWNSFSITRLFIVPFFFIILSTIFAAHEYRDAILDLSEGLR